MDAWLQNIGILTQITLGVALVWNHRAQHRRWFYWGKVAQLSLCSLVYLAMYLECSKVVEVYWAEVLLNTLIDFAILYDHQPGDFLIDAWAVLLILYSYVKAMELAFSPVYSWHPLDAIYHVRQFLDVALDCLSIAALYSVSQQHKETINGTRPEEEALPAYPYR